jgi:hypothetical protein
MTYGIFDKLSSILDLLSCLKKTGWDITTPRVIVIGHKVSDGEEVANYMVGKAYYTSAVCPVSVRLVEAGKVEYREVRRVKSKWTDMEIVRLPYDLKLIRRYIEHPSSVIVVAISASDALPRDLLDLVALVDPKAERTVGVLTWIDQCDAKKVAEILMSDKLKLPFRLIGFSREVGWLETHPVYSALPMGFTGTDSVIAHIGLLLKRVVAKALDETNMPLHIRNDWN